jgi:hypothetical protein
MLIPAAGGRRRGKGASLPGPASGAPAPVIIAYTQYGKRQVEFTGQGKNVQAPEQLIIKDGTGKEFNVTVNPRMTADALKKKIGSLGAKDPLQTGFSCHQVNLQTYESLFKEAWPNCHFQHISSILEGPREVLTKCIFTVTDRYYRAIAKIGLHYYLTHSQRYSGLETEFAPIKNFIIAGGDLAPFFGFPSHIAFRQPPPPYGFASWGHVLAAGETYNCVEAYVRLFVGPEYPGPEHHIRLCPCNFKFQLLRPVVAHSYNYDPGPPTRSGPVGEVHPLPLTPLRRTSLR